MLRTIILIAPVFVSLFWAFALISDSKSRTIPQRFLSIFMLLTSLIFFSHFLYFAPNPDLYVYFDLALQLIGVIIFPLLHIYFRLLTVDEKFSFKAHTKFLILTVVIVALYGLAVFNSSLPEYKAWLFNEIDNTDPNSFQFLHITRVLIQATFVFQVLFFTIANHLMINKYADKAEQFYSNIRDAKTNYAKMLNYSAVLLGLSSIVIFGIGRKLLLPQNYLIVIGWSVFTILLFQLGNLGFKQKLINPPFSLPEIPVQTIPVNQVSDEKQKNLMDKILLEFNQKKIYLDKNLSIIDVAKIIGSNRSYISAAINREFDQNFCTFVNTFRIKELEHLILKNPNSSAVEYAERCGFGSINSMKRSVLSSTGTSFLNFKASISLH